jgi:hypothetical protein
MTEEAPVFTKITVTYGVASKSAQKHVGDEAIALRVAVLEHNMLLVIPMPKWFRKHTYKSITKVEGITKGAKFITVEKTVWDYVDHVVITKVFNYLVELGYGYFELSICGQ